MVEISAALVKELRERTGAGMMECKKALVEAQGDMDHAIENMRKAGQAKAVKKAGRVSAEGTIIVLEQGNRAILLETNCETDFVAREPRFQAFAKQAATQILSQGSESELEAQRLELISQLGENIVLRRHVRMDAAADEYIGAYAHGDANGVRIGTLVLLKGGSTDIAKDIAMHVAAMAPQYISADQIPAERLAQEKEIFICQTREEGKPEAMIEKIVAGKVNKFSAEVSLLAQSFIKNPEQTIAAWLKATGGQVQQFVRFEVGEGIEKKQDNFAEEVMTQVRG